jgi:hypothetical protein
MGIGAVSAVSGANPEPPEPPDPQPESSPTIRINKVPKMALGV